MEQPIIAPIDKAILKEELNTKATLLRHARKGGTDIYIFNGNECPDQKYNDNRQGWPILSAPR